MMQILVSKAFSVGATWLMVNSNSQVTAAKNKVCFVECISYCQNLSFHRGMKRLFLICEVAVY